MSDILHKTIENGEITEVQISPIGSFYGSDSQGNPVPENLTVEALSALADKMNSGDEVLCDVDHQSCRPGVEKDTSAAGWFTNFVVHPLRGLFAKLKLTRRGRELLENREYRFTSPTFLLDDEGKPIDMHSISLTNTPAFKNHIKPIINSEATPIDNTTESITDMTKEELTTLIKETVKNELQMLNTCADKKTEVVKNEEVKEENKDEIEKIKEEVKEELKAEEIKEEVNEEIKEEINGEVKEEEVKEELRKALNEEEKKEDKKEEVIKMEVLNSAPTPSMEKSEPWRNLHGKEFFDWLRKNS